MDSEKDNLPLEILIKIANKLHSIKDLVKFGSVNKAHHQAMEIVLIDHMRSIDLEPLGKIDMMIKTLIKLETTYKDHFPAGKAKTILSKHKTILSQQKILGMKLRRRISEILNRHLSFGEDEEPYDLIQDLYNLLKLE